MILNDLSMLLGDLKHYNQYLYALLVLGIFFGLSKLAVMIAEKVLLKLTAKTQTTVDDEIVKATHGPVSILLLLYGFDIFFLEIWRQYIWSKQVESFLYSIMILIVTFTCVKVVNILITAWGTSKFRKNHAHLDDQLLKLIHQFVTILLYIIGILCVISVWGVEIGPFLAGLGIGGIAVAFALQSTLANVLGGISLIFDKAIKVGDVIKLEGGEMGTVHDIGLRSTRIKTPTNEILIVPNGKLVDSKVLNYCQPNRVIRVDIEFGVAYGSDIGQVKELALSCLKAEKNVLKEPIPDVWFTQMADSALNFKLMFYVDDLDNKWPTHQNVITRLYERLNAKKIGIPFPQRELWVHNLKK